MRIPLLTVALLAGPVTSLEAARPNVIVMLCDDMGAHELGLYGHPKHRTPKLDELGRTGIWFTTGYAPSVP